MKKKKIYIILSAVVVVAIAIWYFSGSNEKVDQKVNAQRGLFEIVVNTTGDLQALNMEYIQTPDELRGRNVRIGEVKIQDLIAEGTVVDSGDWVANLDRSGIDNTIKVTEQELEQLETSLKSVEIDTTLNMRALRDAIQSLEFALKEAEIVVEQSEFEPPATQRKVANDYQKALRSLEQDRTKYILRHEQETRKIRDAEARLERKQNEYNDLHVLLHKSAIYAPQKGMVIYHKHWGTKRRAGTTINVWDKIIATLPDLSVMISTTYVNEVDISKVRQNQIVRMGVDAFPDKRYTGVVTSIANVGEQLYNSDAKVFEVVIRMDQSDTLLRPSMTTSNEIIISTLEDVVYLPLEAIHADSVPFVYRTNGTKQVVILGVMNHNYRVIEQGIEEGDEVYLSAPEKPETFKLVGEELISILKEKETEALEREVAGTMGNGQVRQQNN